MTVQGAPYQVGDLVEVVGCADELGYPERVGERGRVRDLNYGADGWLVGQVYPCNPLVVVRMLVDGQTVELWPEELARGERDHPRRLP